MTNFKKRILGSVELEEADTSSTSGTNLSAHTPTSLNNYLGDTTPEPESVPTTEERSTYSPKDTPTVKSQPEVQPSKGIIDNNFKADQDTTQTTNDIVKHQNFFDRYSAILNT